METQVVPNVIGEPLSEEEKQVIAVALAHFALGAGPDDIVQITGILSSVADKLDMVSQVADARAFLSEQLTAAAAEERGGRRRHGVRG